jgi:hypothetical protein
VGDGHAAHVGVAAGHAASGVEGGTARSRARLISPTQEIAGFLVDGRGWFRTTDLSRVKSEEDEA